jgi:hypothetical protein
MSNKVDTGTYRSNIIKTLIVNKDIKVKIKQTKIEKTQIIATSVTNAMTKTPKNWGVVRKTETHNYFYKFILFNNYIFSGSLFDLVKFTELLKLFTNNKLNKYETYYIWDKVLKANLIENKGKVKLNFKIDNKFLNSDKDFVFDFNKLQASSIVFALNKIISKLEFEFEEE